MSSPSTSVNAKNIFRTKFNSGRKMFARPLFFCFFTLMTACSGSSPEKLRDSKIFEAWDVINQPSRFGRDFETRFDNLSKAGRLNKIPWSDSYWASQRAGIAFRWLAPLSPPFGYQVHARPTVTGFSAEQLSKLSPAEKLDIFMGRFDFPTVQSERRRTSPAAAAWEGLCHGWAPASLEFNEPEPVTVTGENNIKIPFGSSDIKALLSWYMALHNPVSAIGLGGRCNFGGTLGMNTPACRDSNAGAFHIVLTNMISKYKEGFIVDIARAAEVWNQPVYGFRTRELSRQRPTPGAAAGTAQEVIVETEIQYTMEIEAQWNALGQLAERPVTGSTVYRYRIELDRQGVIRGGEWLQDARPDFIWMQQRGEFDAGHKAIEKIYAASVR